MSTVHLLGALEFASPARRQAGLAAFEAARFTEYTDLADFVARGGKGLAIDVTREVEADCVPHYHRAFVALTNAAKSGKVELRWDRGVGHWGATWAGGHYLELEPAPRPGPLRSLAPQRLMKTWTKWPGRVAEAQMSDVRFTAATVSPDGATLVAAGGPPASPLARPATWMAPYKLRAHWGVAAFDVATGQERWRSFAAAGPVGALAVTPDNEAVLAGSADGNLYLLDAATGALLHAEKKALPGGCIALAFTRDGRTFAAGGRLTTAKLRESGLGGQVVQLWSLPGWTSRRASRGTFASISGLAFDRAGRQLTVWTQGVGGPSAAVLALGGAAKGKPTRLPGDGWDLVDGCIVRAG